MTSSREEKTALQPALCLKQKNAANYLDSDGYPYLRTR